MRPLINNTQQTDKINLTGNKTTLQKHINRASQNHTVNLSDRILTTTENRVLERGLTFIPTSRVIPVSNIINSKNALIRNIKLRSYFTNREKNNSNFNRYQFVNKSTWTPDIGRLDAGTRGCIDKIERDTENYIRHNTLDNTKIRNKCKYNLTREEVMSIRALQEDTSIVIKPFDKGGGTTILNKTNYINEAHRQLYNQKYYTKLDKLATAETASNIHKVVDAMYKEGHITDKQLEYLTGPEEFRPRTFYLLPKIHKPKSKWPDKQMPEGRPIVSDIDSESYRISEFIEYHINPLSVKHASYIKNSFEFVNRIRNRKVKSTAFIVTGDVSALYTNMHIDRSINCVRKALEANQNPDRPDQHIIELLNITMRTNDFEFNGEYFLQKLGTAMGKRYAPSLANIYMIDFDEAAMNGFRIKPKLYFRYLDDIFFIWEGTEEQLKEYEEFLNTILPDIKITLEYNKNSNSFLDTTIYKQQESEQCTLQTRVFFKDTDTHQLLHCDSAHPAHTFKGITKSQYIRFKRLSSTKADYIQTCKIFNAYLKHRGYTSSKLRKEMHEIWNNHSEKPKPTELQKEKSTTVFPIITDFWEGGKELQNKYKTALSHVEKFSKFKFISAYKVGRNLGKILTRSKLPPRTDGSYEACYDSRCMACQHADDSEIFMSTTNKKTFYYSQRNNCATKNCIYLITCRKCKMQYVGETSRELRQRLTDHRSCIKRKVQTPIGIHFNKPGHSAKDLKITIIESLDAINGGIKLRRRKETEWQMKLGTIYPQGLNNMPIDNKT